MPRMLELIRDSKVPSNMMYSAAHGSLSLPPGETLEVLVYLALHHQLFGEQARLTLAGWDEKASLDAAADPTTSPEVLGYFVSPENLRPSLLLALADNPSVSEEQLDGLAVSGLRSTVELLLTSARVMKSARLLQALQSNPNLRSNEQAEIAKKLSDLERSPAEAVAEAQAPDEAVESAVLKYLEENAAELETEKNKPFLPIGIAPEGLDQERRMHDASPVVDAAVDTQSPNAAAKSVDAGEKSEVDAGAKSPAVAAKLAAGAAAAAHAKKHPVPAHEERRDSTSAANFKARYQGTDRSGDARQQGRTIDSDPRCHQTGGGGGAGIAQSFGD